MINSLKHATAATPDNWVRFMTTFRRGLLQQVAYIERQVEGELPPQLEAYFQCVRRSNLQTVREIEAQLGLKPSKRERMKERLKTLPKRKR